MPMFITLCHSESDLKRHLTHAVSRGYRFQNDARHETTISVNLQIDFVHVSGFLDFQYVELTKIPHIICL